MHAAQFVMRQGECHFIARIQTGKEGVGAFNKAFYALMVV